MMESPQNDEVFLVKLEILKEIRSKTICLEKLKVRILHLMEALKKEDEHLSSYRTEVEQLKREKMLLVESLRNIDQDLNLMESNIVEAKQARERTRQKTHSLLEEYSPLKIHIDSQRMQIGLGKLTDISGMELMLPERSSTNYNHKSASSYTMVHSSSLSSSSSPQETYIPTVCSRGLVNEPSPSFLAMSEVKQTPRRQQKPPMKTCASCQELIHRNAPVCPMCKAKSKSKNPKRPKRKLEGE